jgi:hypothetical protein
MAISLTYISDFFCQIIFIQPIYTDFQSLKKKYRPLLIRNLNWNYVWSKMAVITSSRNFKEQNKKNMITFFYDI